MKLSPQDLRKLRYPLIGFAIALILMTLTVGYATQRKNMMQQAVQKQQNQLSQARQRYQSSGLEKETIIQYLPLYQQLISRGFVGEERRIEWVDHLRTIQQQHKLFGINYSISTQEAYKPGFALNVGSFSAYRSTMKLELFMLHEGDLLTMIEAMDAEQTAPFILRECEITRLAANNIDKLTPNLVAKCELDWLTIHEPQVAGVATP